MALADGAGHSPGKKAAGGSWAGGGTVSRRSKTQRCPGQANNAGTVQTDVHSLMVVLNVHLADGESYRTQSVCNLLSNSVLAQTDTSHSAN